MSRIDKLVTQLPVPQPWDRRRFIEHVAQMRGRPITVISMADLALPVTHDNACGIWLMRDRDDVIIHEAATSEYHIDQIVCHELGHMLLDHAHATDTTSGTLGPDPLLHSVFPDLDPSTVRAVLGRSNYGDRLEREAETFATLVMVAATADHPRQSLRNVLFRQQQ